MPFDVDLAERLREVVAEHGEPDERSMFGGRAFLRGGHLAVCASHDGGLLVRVPAEDQARLCEQAGVEPMVMGTKTSRTWVRVAASEVADERALRTWTARGLAVATSLPPEP